MAFLSVASSENHETAMAVGLIKSRNMSLNMFYHLIGSFHLLKCSVKVKKHRIGEWYFFFRLSRKQQQQQ